ncbi:MAG: hypothetical protein DRP83_00950 [Planctomycetota bacterium]|nr:MAG: hypothetical protein DRP83_00950 [Planctomycetota bacterium]
MTDDKDRAAPMIGQFSGPPTNSPRVALRRKDESEGEIEEKEAEKGEVQQATSKTPTQIQNEFMKGLEDVGLELNQARAIMDEVLEKGYWTETHQIRKKELIVRSRGYRDTLRSQRFLEVENPTYAMGMDEIIMRYNSAASLVRFGDRKFDFPEDQKGTSDEEIEAAFEERRRFLEGLPSIVVGKINTIVFNMDVKLGAVFAEGAPEDF